MRNILLFLSLLIACSALAPMQIANAAKKTKASPHPQQILDKQLQATIDSYLKKEGKREKDTAVALSFSLPKEVALHSYYAGRNSNKPSASSINEDSLFQIGSITKSYTSAAILQLEAEGKLDINDKIGKWLPQYPQWENVSIKSLLNMTSGIKNYTKSTVFEKGSLSDIQKIWTTKELIDLAEPNKPISANPAWNYSNTNYLLASMIIEAVTKHTYAEEIQTRFISKLNLKHTFYSDAIFHETVIKQLVHGYAYDNKTHKLDDVTSNSSSWGQAAGGIIGNTQDIVYWVKALYSTQLFPKKQLQELMTLVSVITGKPIVAVQHSEGFGLGVGYRHFKTLKGNFWFYQGSTLGYRAAYIWNDCNGIVVAAALNSRPSSDKVDHLKDLLAASYKKILVAYPEYVCRD